MLPDPEGVVLGHRCEKPAGPLAVPHRQTKASNSCSVVRTMRLIRCRDLRAALPALSSAFERVLSWLVTLPIRSPPTAVRHGPTIRRVRSISRGIRECSGKVREFSRRSTKRRRSLKRQQLLSDPPRDQPVASTEVVALHWFEPMRVFELVCRWTGIRPRANSHAWKSDWLRSSELECRR